MSDSQETLAFRFEIGYKHTKVIGQDLFLADHIDYLSFPEAKPFSSSETDVVFVLTTSRCWNLLNKKLIELAPGEIRKPGDVTAKSWGPENKRFRLTWHRSFQIAETDIVRVFMNNVGVIFWAQCDLTTMGKNYDPASTIRFGTEDVINVLTHPLVVITREAWNNIQRVVDELNVRAELRHALSELRAPSFLIKKDQLFKATREKFAEQRERKNNTTINYEREEKNGPAVSG